VKQILKGDLTQKKGFVNHYLAMSVLVIDITRSIGMMHFMLKIIQDPETIARCRRLFLRRFRPFIDEKIPVRIGHRGASFPAKVSWSRSLVIWMGFLKGDDIRYGHVFGLGRPAPGGNIPMACEMNFPVRGIDRRVGAAFARDDRGRIFAIHRGNIGGSQKGIGKTLFEGRYRGVWADMDEDGATVTVALVGEVSSPRFPRQAAQFVHKVAKIKAAAMAAAAPQTAIPLDSGRFSEELVGERHEDLRQDLSKECDHGLIVRDLAAALQAVGLRTGNDAYRDLMIFDRESRTRAVFQICPDIHLKRIHEGVMRLFFNGLRLSPSCRLILAVPEPLEPTLRARLKDLNMETLIYAWREGQAVFPDLEDLMGGQTDLLP
jgi:hypothetical protein